MKPLRTRGYLATPLQTLTEYQGSFAGEVEGTLRSTGITVPRHNQATYQCDNDASPQLVTFLPEMV